MNVQSTSRGPNGHGGKLLYLYDQVKAYGLNIVGYKKDAMMSQSVLPTRSTASMPDTKVDNMELKCGSTCQQPVARDTNRQPVYLRPQALQVAHSDPQRLIVRCQCEVLQCWFFVAHAPHSGKAAVERTQWWRTTDDLIDKNTDEAPWSWMVDATASPGAADHKAVRESLHKIIQTIPHCAWQTDVETQAHDLARHLHNAMANIAHPDIEAKKPYITDEIWQLRAHKLKLKKRLKDATEGTAVQLLKAAFGFWKSPSSDDAQNVQTFFDYSTTVHCRRIRLFAALRIKSVQLRRQLQTANRDILMNVFSNWILLLQQQVTCDARGTM